MSTQQSRLDTLLLWKGIGFCTAAVLCPPPPPRQLSGALSYLNNAVIQTSQHQTENPTVLRHKLPIHVFKGESNSPITVT